AGRGDPHSLPRRRGGAGAPAAHPAGGCGRQPVRHRRGRADATGADRPGTAGAGTHGPRRLQRRDRRRPGRQRHHRQDPRRQRAGQARCPRPGPGGGARLRDRPGPAAGAGAPRAEWCTVSEVVLRCEGLRKTYGDLLAVDDLSLSIAEGETYGLLGPNGAGKTTAISMIVGVLARDAGTVTVDGRPHDVHGTAGKALIGYVPQQLALYTDLTARENLRFFGRLYGLSGRELSRRTDEVLEVVGLADRAGQRVDKFSGGMARRLHIGVGLLNRPRLLVLDEPTAGVDPQSRNAIMESVARLAGEGIAVLYTTHYMEEAERLCDRVGILDQGRLRAEGTR